MPYDSSNQGEYLTSQWLSEYNPALSQVLRERYEKGFLLRKVRDPSKNHFPIVAPQKRLGPISLPTNGAPFVISQPHSPTTDDIPGLSDGSGNVSTGSDGTIMSSDYVSSGPEDSAPVPATSGPDPTTGGGGTSGENSTGSDGTLVPIETTDSTDSTSYTEAPPTPYPPWGVPPPEEEPEDPPVDPPPIDPEGITRTICDAEACDDVFAGGIDYTFPVGFDPDTSGGVCDFAVTDPDGGPYSGSAFTQYFDGCGNSLVQPCDNSILTNPPPDLCDDGDYPVGCYSLTICCYKQKQEYDEKGNPIGGPSTGTYSVVSFTRCCCIGS